jgi:hypothetical protein
MTILLDPSLTDSMLDHVSTRLAEGVLPEDIYVNLAGDWTRVRSIPDPVLRELALRALRKMQSETTDTSPTT